MSWQSTSTTEINRDHWKYYCKLIWFVVVFWPQKFRAMYRCEHFAWNCNILASWNDFTPSFVFWENSCYFSSKFLRWSMWWTFFGGFVFLLISFIRKMMNRKVFLKSHLKSQFLLSAKDCKNWSRPFKQNLCKHVSYLLACVQKYRRVNWKRVSKEIHCINIFWGLKMS